MDLVDQKTEATCNYHVDGLEVQLHEPGPLPEVPETFVHDLWATQKFDPSHLTTTAGEPIEILDPGQYNTDSGPDFRLARLRIGEVLWCGDVEIHLRSANWVEHGHHNDPRYNGVVLHVSFLSDLWTGSLLRADGTRLPELILYSRLDRPLRSLLYAFHTSAESPVPCLPQWPLIPEAVRNTYIDELGWERIEERRTEIVREAETGIPLTEILHERLFAGLGYAKNTGPMRELARRLPLETCRMVHDATDLEALHFGVAGLIPQPVELLKADRATADYAMDLKDRFDRLSLHLSLPIMDRLAWQFFRLRPANFPTLRIAQAVVLLREWLLTSDPLATLTTILDRKDAAQAIDHLLTAHPGTFWQTHVRLDRPSQPHSPELGADRIRGLLINVLAPVALAANGGGLEIEMRDLLTSLPPEKDEITRVFTDAGQKCRNALSAQGIHQLFRTRCERSRCLSCIAGQFLLDRPEVLSNS